MGCSSSTEASNSRPTPQSDNIRGGHRSQEPNDDNSTHATLNTTKHDLEEVAVKVENAERQRKQRIVAAFGPDMVDSILMDAVRRGVNLRFVKKLLVHVEKLFDQGHFNLSRKFEDGTELSPPLSFDDLSTTHVVYLWIKEQSVTGERRFVDCPELFPDLFEPSDVGVPQYFISHAWSGSFKKLLTSVLAFLKDASDTETYVWIDQLAVNQHRHTDLAKAQNDADVGAFKSVVQICSAGTIVVVDANRCNPASRAWCVYEWAWTLIFHGPDGLHMVGMTADDLQLIINGIDVEKARCFDPDGSIKKMILNDVLQQSGSYEKFNNGLKLQLMLSPLSLKVDMRQLLKRSMDTVWSFDQVLSWIESAEASPRALCVLGGAGTGKSTISAALIETLRSKSKVDGLKIGYHFLKYSDQRRLNPIKILTSLAFILAPQLPEYEKALLSLDVNQILALRDMDRAFSLLFESYSNILASSGNILLLIDALDESDAPGTFGFWKPMSNKAVQLIVGCLSKLPPNVRFFFTARPDTLFGNIKATLLRALKVPGGEDGVKFFDPGELRVDQGGSGGKVMVYDCIVSECGLSSALPTLPHPTLDDLHLAYKMVFDRSPPSGPVTSLLQVLMAAREPLSALLLSQLGLLNSLPLLPGSGCLFFMEEHRVFLLHKSLSDWLLTKDLSRGHYVDVANGNRLLGICLFENEISAARDPVTILSSIPGARVSGPGVRSSEYALKYGVHHLYLSDEYHSFGRLDEALGSWEFLRQVFESGNGSLLMRDLSQLVEACDLVSQGIKETLSWLRMNFNDFELHPDKIECLTLRSPLSRVKYSEAVCRLKPSWVTSAVLGKVSQQDWPKFTNIFKGHTNAVLAVKYSPDGTYFATAGRDSTARLWDATDGSCIALLQGHSATISSVCFSADGKLLATSSEDATARLWDLSSGGIVSIFEGHEGPVGSVALSPNGIHAVTVAGHGGYDYTARLYDIASGECLLVMDDAYQCSSIFFSLDGKLLGASCGHAHEAKVWDVSNIKRDEPVKCISTLQHHCYVNYACFSPDGLKLVSAGSDQVARIWDVASSECIQELKGHTENVICCVYSPNASWLATGSWDTTVRLWDASTGHCMIVLEGHTGYLGSVSFSPCGRRLVTGSFDMRAMQWDVNESLFQSKSLEGHRGLVASLSFSPCGSRLVTGSHDSKAKLWDTSNGSFVATLETPLWRGENWRCAVSFSPNGSLIATGEVFSDVSVRVLEVGGGIGYTMGEGNYKRQNVFSLSFSPDGSQLATAFDNGTVGLWDMETKERVSTLQGHEIMHVNSVSFSPDGRILASGSSDHTVRLWSPVSGECLSVLESHTGRITGVAFSPDGQRLATSSGYDNRGKQYGMDCTLRLWDVARRECIMKMQGRLGSLKCVAWSPDGKFVATGSSDHTARVWDAASGDCMAILYGHSDKVVSVSFSTDGKLATGSCDNTARLWEY